MKNTNFKTKFVAKMAVIVVLLLSTIVLNSCVYIGISESELNSHKEFLEFVQSFNSINDKNIASFISFDFDNNDKVQNKVYEYHLEIRRYPFIETGNYDKYSDLAIVQMYFYLYYEKENIRENEYQIMCSYSTKEFNFYQNSNLQLVLAEGDPRDTTYKQHNRDNFNYYVHTQKYQLLADGKNVMNIYVSSTLQPTQEQLDEICQLLMDNIVIINTEG